uniref:Uncharacterized protein n=1 Tax=Glossina pallidipes TaxID=7398 RepID=A0A1A9Z722_GLOPL
MKSLSLEHFDKMALTLISGEETKAKFGGDITGVNFALPLLPASLLMLPPSELENEFRISIAFCAFTAEAMSTVELVDGVSIICKVTYPLFIFGLLVLPSKTSVELFSCSEELPLPPPLPPIMLTIGGKLAKSCEPSCSTISLIRADIARIISKGRWTVEEAIAHISSCSEQLRPPREFDKAFLVLAGARYREEILATSDELKIVGKVYKNIHRKSHLNVADIVYKVSSKNQDKDQAGQANERERENMAED